MNWVYDIETTLDWKKIRAVGFYNGAKTQICYTPSDVFDFVRDFIVEGDELWQWNGHKFDNDILWKVWGINMNELLSSSGASSCDGMILAKMMYPDQHGGHSLDNFAKKYYLKGYKPWKPEDISWYDTAPLPEIVAYLVKDLQMTKIIVDGLIRDAVILGGKWKHPRKIEQRVREITNEQVDKAVRFNIPDAEHLWMELDQEMEGIENDLLHWLPCLPVNKPKPPPKKQFKQDGTLSELMKKYIADMDLYWNENDKSVTKGSFHRTLPFTDPAPQFEQITLKNQTRVKEWLLDLGWKPTWWNTKQDPHSFKKIRTTPRLNHSVSKAPCKDLMRFGTQGEQITEWLMLRSRRSMLANESKTTGLIAKALKGGGYIASEADTCGTPTARWRHKGIVNIPRVSSPYGKEIRSLFEARPGTRWVGWDASSLEACIEAHYTYPYDPDYAMSLTEGDSSKGTDVHSRNMLKLGLESRDKAKTFKYAITYGAQAASLAEQLSVPRSQGDMLFEEFWRQNDGLRELRDQLLAEWKYYNKKYIIGLDGRLIATRSEHSLINTKFQSGGAIVMKHAMLIANKEIKAYAEREGFNAYGLIRYHDEEQWETDAPTTDQTAKIGEIGCNSITKAGQYLKLNVPLSGDYKVGRSWADTH